MERLAEIRVTKSILLIPEKILWQYLPACEIEQGIRRGKGYKRAERVIQYEAKIGGVSVKMSVLKR